MANEAYAGQQRVTSGNDDINQLDFIVRSILSGQATTTLVEVKAVTNDGGVSPVGMVDVKPMVAQIDGKGDATPHGVIHNVPYFRLQGGQNAVILDPAVGDIGIAVFASRDISSVKNTKKAGNPGSRRQFDWADALYLGGVLNSAPVRYIQFDSDGNVTIKPAAKVTVDGDLHCTGTMTADVDVIGNGVSLHDHTHGGVQSGSSDTEPPN